MSDRSCGLARIHLHGRREAELDAAVASIGTAVTAIQGYSPGSAVGCGNGSCGSAAAAPQTSAAQLLREEGCERWTSCSAIPWRTTNGWCCRTGLLLDLELVGGVHVFRADVAGRTLAILALVESGAEARRDVGQRMRPR